MKVYSQDFTVKKDSISEFAVHTITEEHYRLYTVLRY